MVRRLKDKKLDYRFLNFISWPSMLFDEIIYTWWSFCVCLMCFRHCFCFLCKWSNGKMTYRLRFDGYFMLSYYSIQFNSIEFNIIEYYNCIQYDIHSKKNTNQSMYVTWYQLIVGIIYCIKKLLKCIIIRKIKWSK